jgi:two-component system nitrogen regulation response regulator GlnG
MILFDDELKNVPKEGLADSVELHIKQFISMLEGDMSKGSLYQLVIREVERPLIKNVLEYTNYNQIKAANVLGINRNTLRKKIKELGIELLK